MNGMKPSLNTVNLFGFFYYFHTEMRISGHLATLNEKGQRGTGLGCCVVVVAYKALDCLGSVGIRDGNLHISHSVFFPGFLSHSTDSSSFCPYMLFL